MMQLNVSHDFLPKKSTTRATIVMDHFGIGFEQGQHVIASDLEIPVRSGEIVLLTGESGSGKSSLMHAIRQKLSAPGTTVIDVDELDLGDSLLIDALDVDVRSGMSLLSACGLGEAQLMLRTPGELSDGQRYRFRFARALSGGADWIVADEYTATLDRTLANVISHNLHKLAAQMQTGFLLATTHEDVIEDLNPHVRVHCRLDGTITVRDRTAEDNDKKKTLAHARPLDLTRDQVRLDVLRSVALPQPSDRTDPVHDATLV